MATLAFAAPCVPGGSDVLRRLAREVQGARQQEFDTFHARVGLERESWYLQQTPQGEMCIVYLVGDDPVRSIQTLAASSHPFDQWVKEEVKLVHGIDFNQPPAGPLPEVIVESSIAGPAPRASVAIAIPLLPGKTEEWRSFTDAVKGPRRGELDDFHRRVGLTTENWYLQKTPMADVVIVYLEGDIPDCFARFASSEHPFDRYLKHVWLSTEGIDFNQPLPGLAPEAVYDSLPQVLRPAGVGGI
jgi:hypothetical protein